MKRKNIELLCYLFLISFNLFSQNEYVINGGFEDYTNMRVKVWNGKTYKNIANNWTSASFENFKPLVDSIVNLVEVVRNVEKTIIGKNYIEISSVITTTVPVGLTSIQTKLKENLVKDKMYLLSLDLKSFGSCCDRYIKSCKFIFTDYAFTKKDYAPVNKPFVLLYNCDSSLLKEDWITAYNKYIAKGDEVYLTIELNLDRKQTQNIPCKPNTDCSSTGRHSIDSYYYLDNVSIKENIDCFKIDCNKKIVSTYTKDAVLVLPNINFFTNSDSLTKSSFVELDKLLLELKSNPNLEIEISGHTDDVGSAEKNMKLSDLRAKSVKRYFVSKGINEKRMQTKGEGYNKPLLKATDEASRAKNRRVEIKVLKN
ncbi:MAG: OmpA family protein [Bacteroidota bacterium]